MKDSIREALFNMGEEEYRDFSSKLMPHVPKEKVIGIRIPVLRKYAKSLDNYGEFLKSLPHEYFEENNLHAFLIEREKDFHLCILKLEAFLPYVDNWATCDSIKPKVLKKHKKELFEYIKKWLLSKNVYMVRYAVNLLMSLYLDEDFAPCHLSLVAGVKSGEYYINMMRAWYFATALAKQYERTLPLIEGKVLDVWTHNKTIQKAKESLRIAKEQKEYLNTLKR